jgi:hypothetical protein
VRKHVGKNLHHMDADSNFSARILVDKQCGFKHGLAKNNSEIANEKETAIRRGRGAKSSFKRGWG